jgi:hypothetical protein
MRRALRIAVLSLLLIAAGVGALAGAAYLAYHRDLPAQAQGGPVGLWLEHRWVGETQTVEAYDALAAELRWHGISDLFAHVGPLDGQGEIPAQRYPNAAAFVAALHARLPGVHLQAWMGQMEKRRGGPLDLADAARAPASCARRRSFSTSASTASTTTSSRCSATMRRCIPCSTPPAR